MSGNELMAEVIGKISSGGFGRWLAYHAGSAAGTL